MKIQSVNILLDFNINYASEDIGEKSPVDQLHSEVPSDNQVLFKPTKQDTNSILSPDEEEEKDYRIHFIDSAGQILRADVVDTRKDQGAKYNSDCIVNIKGQAVKIQPMSPRSYKQWSRHQSSSLVMPRLNESCSGLDDQDSWKEIS